MSIEEQTREIHQRIAEIQARYQDEIAPLLKILADIESLKPLPRMIVTREQAEAMGFTIQQQGPRP